MKIVTSTLSIKLIASCPYCGEYADLINDDLENSEESCINDCGEITNQAVGCEDIEYKHENFNKNILCASCRKEFKVKKIEW